MNPTLTRREMLAGLGVSAAFVAGCSNNSAPAGDDAPAADDASEGEPAADEGTDELKDVTIELWHTLTGDDGTVLGAMVEEFNKEHSGQIKVSIQAMSSSDFKAKLPMAFEEGNDSIPDLGVLSTAKTRSYAHDGMLLPVDDVLAEMGLGAADFTGPTWDGSEVGDGSERYAIPLDSTSVMLYYNADILAELGYTPDDLYGVSKDDFLKMCQEAQDKGYRGVGVWWGRIEDVFFTYLVQNGETTVKADNPTEPLFNDQVGLDAVEYFKSLFDAGVTNGLDEHPETMFQQGDTLFCMTFMGSVQGMNAITTLNWGITFLPLWGDRLCVWAGSDQLVLYKKDHTDDSRRACEIFARWFSDHGTEWAQAGSVPSRVDVLQSQEYLDLKWAFGEDDADKFVFAENCLTTSDVKTSLNENVYDYYLGNIPTAEEALQRAYDDGKAKAEKTMADA